MTSKMVPKKPLKNESKNDQNKTKNRPKMTKTRPKTGRILLHFIFFITFYYI